MINVDANVNDLQNLNLSFGLCFHLSLDLRTALSDLSERR